MSEQLNNKNLIITFCGHSKIYKEDTGVIANELFGSLEKYFIEYKYSDYSLIFYCGGYGAFDELVSKIIDELRIKYPTTKTQKLFITPYILESSKDKNESMRDYYDEIVFPPIEDTPFKFAISARNKWMVDESDVVIAYVCHYYGGASKTLIHAYKKKKTIIRIVSDYDVI